MAGWTIVHMPSALSHQPLTASMRTGPRRCGGRSQRNLRARAREVGVRVPAVIERDVVLLAELAPYLRFGRRVRIVPEADAEAPVNDAAAHAIRARVAGLQKRNRMAERFGVRPESNLVQIPEARLVVVRIRQVVQLFPLDEFLQRFALRAAAFT